MDYIQFDEGGTLMSVEYFSVGKDQELYIAKKNILQLYLSGYCVIGSCHESGYGEEDSCRREYVLFSPLWLDGSHLLSEEQLHELSLEYLNCLVFGFSSDQSRSLVELNCKRMVDDIKPGVSR